MSEGACESVLIGAYPSVLLSLKREIETPINTDFLLCAAHRGRVSIVGKDEIMLAYGFDIRYTDALADTYYRRNYSQSE